MEKKDKHNYIAAIIVGVIGAFLFALARLIAGIAVDSYPATEALHQFPKDFVGTFPLLAAFFAILAGHKCDEKKWEVKYRRKNNGN